MPAALRGRHGPARPGGGAQRRLASGPRRDHRLHRRRLHSRPRLAGGGHGSRSSIRRSTPSPVRRSSRCRRTRPTTSETRPASKRAEFVTANCFCRREVLEAVGGFDERFTAAWREDSDLHFRLLDTGGTIVRVHGGRRCPSRSAGRLGSQPPAAAQVAVSTPSSFANIATTFGSGFSRRGRGSTT